MARKPLRTRFLKIETICESWHPELRYEFPNLPKDELLRLLRLGVINVDRILNGLERLEVQPPDNELPPADTRVDWLWITTFCHKQEFPQPRFWGPEEEEPVKSVGQPDKSKSLIMELFYERMGADLLKTTCAAEARELRQLALKKADPAKVPVARYIETLIRIEFTQYKKRRKTAS